MMALEEKFGIYFPMDFNLFEARNVEQFVKVITSRIISAES
jgi:acyl carrier protein